MSVFFITWADFEDDHYNASKCAHLWKQSFLFIQNAFVISNIWQDLSEMQRDLN